jgi:hypothetical protein
VQPADKHWWQIIALACKPDGDAAQWQEGLFLQLCQLSTEEILDFDRWFDARVCEAYTADLSNAKYLVTGLGGPDGMYYFQNWLIAQGREIYTNAVANADTLADVKRESEADDWETEIYAVPQDAWGQVTGLGADAYPLVLPGRNDGAREVGEAWDWDDRAEFQRRLPRLFAKYGKLDNEG